MKRLLIACTLAAGLAAPSVAAASPDPNRTDRQNAAEECRDERGTTDASREAFRQRYGTNANKRNAFGKCVSQNAREEHAERHAARREAVEECRAERAADPEAFRNKYGTNANKRNAFGKCVSQKARQNKAEEDQEDAEEAEARKNAAEQCDEERGETAESRQAFRNKYGTNRNKSNAFGKCVSQKAQAQNDD